MKTALTFLQNRRKDLHCALDATRSGEENTFWCQKLGFFFPSQNTLPHNNLRQVLSGGVGGKVLKPILILPLVDTSLF